MPEAFAPEVDDLLVPDRAPSESISGRTGFRRRSKFGKAVLMWTRRLHLFAGLFLFPWAVLYGFTAFLFNHPSVFSDARTGSFDRSHLKGTPLESPVDPEALARQVFSVLEQRKPQGATWKLVEARKAGWSREFAFASAKGADGRQVSLLFDMQRGGGTVRVAKSEEKKEVKAPFAVGGRPAGRGRGGDRPQRRQNATPPSDRLDLPDPLQARFAASAAVVLERLGIVASDVVVTSIPALEFDVEADGERWRASYDPTTGSVSGASVGSSRESQTTWRNFLLRLHTTHVYPASWSAKFFWAVVVDVMAFAMCFWGVSGLLMWWQLKATRFAGWLTLAASGAAAIALATAMHQMLAG